MVRKLLAFFGYYPIRYGYSCGRHWIEINGRTIAQTSGDDVYLLDEDIERLGVGIGVAEDWA